MWPPERAFGLHLPIPKGLVSAGQSRFYGIFREPKSRALSSYTYFRRLFNETMPDVGGETPTPPQEQRGTRSASAVSWRGSSQAKVGASSARRRITEAHARRRCVRRIRSALTKLDFG